MPKAIIILSVLFVCLVTHGWCSTASRDEASVEAVRTLTLSGLEFAYNLDFAGAEDKFGRAIALDPSSPRPYVGRASLAFWRFLMSKNDTDLSEFMRRIDDAIQVGEKYLEDHNDDPEALTCLGMSYGYRSFARARVKSYLKSAWDGKKSYDLLYSAIKHDPHSYDAYLGIGLFHYYLTFVPKPLQWIVSVLGITGDSEAGMREIHAAAEKGTFVRTEAKYYLATLLPWHSGDFDGGERILSELISQYPNNTLFVFSRAVWEIRRNDVRSARDLLSGIIQSSNASIPAINPFAHYKLAECYFRLDDYSRALEEYQTFLRLHDDETYLATASYRVGLCYEMLGRRESAIPHYRSAVGSDRTFGDDAYASRRSRERLRTPLSASDSLLIRGQNALKSGEYDRAIDTYGGVGKAPSSGPEQAVEADYYIGEALVDKADYAQALGHFQSVLSTSTAAERWVLPWAHFQSGYCYLKLNDDAAARKEFEKSLDYEDFDFKNWLEYRAKRELDEIKKKSG